MHPIRVAVLRGGPSVEHQVSMRTGKAVLAALKSAVMATKDIVISQNGDWLEAGIVKRPEVALAGVDVVFIALHGQYGEDGEVQKILQRLSLPFTGSRAMPSAIAFNKDMTKRLLADVGVKMAKHKLVTLDDIDSIEQIAAEISQEFGEEYIIKPAASGSSFGVQFISRGDSLGEALTSSLQSSDKVLVEEFIRGREATVATLEDFRGSSIYTFPTVEIVTKANSNFFDTSAKYDGKTEEICPSRFSYSERKALEDVAALVHKNLNLSQYSRSDFIVNDSGVYFLEVNTLPGLTSDSLYPKAAASVGLSLDDLVKHLVLTATC